MKTYIDIFKIFADLHLFLKENGITFTNNGYPVFCEEFILREVPCEILPFSHRNACKDKSKTVICFFENDKFLYRRFFKLKDDLPVYKEYLGVCGFDLSPRIGWSVESQKFNICLSQMATIYLALHGIKIIPNFRIGLLEETISSLASYPVECPFAIGTIGCSQGKVMELEKFYFQTKVLYVLSKELFFYGQLKSEYKEILLENGISYKVFQDFRTHCFNRKENIK